MIIIYSRLTTLFVTFILINGSAHASINIDRSQFNHAISANNINNIVQTISPLRDPFKPYHHICNINVNKVGHWQLVGIMGNQDQYISWWYDSTRYKRGKYSAHDWLIEGWRIINITVDRVILKDHASEETCAITLFSTKKSSTNINN